MKNLITLILCLFLISPSSTMALQDQTRALFKISQDKREGFIDQTGKVVIRPQFRSATDFNDDRACAMPWSASEFKYGVIDSAGEFLTSPHFAACLGYAEGR